MESFKEVFDLVGEVCRKKTSSTGYDLWIQPLEPLRLENDRVYLGVSSDFKRGVLEAKYKKLLEEAFSEVLGFEVSVVFSITSPQENSTPLSATPPVAGGPESLYAAYSSEELDRSVEGGDYEYTFDTFIVGPSNKFAHAASLAVAANPASAYNPLFIYGGSGLGKTHLLRAICNEILKNNPTYNCIYTKGEEFTNEIIYAISTKTTKDFHDKYRQADVLLVDDIQFISGKESTQEEFFHTFEALHQSGKQIVLTSDRPPKEIKTLEDRLKSRFEWGLLADIQPPDFETRIAIIRRKADLLGFTIPDEVADYIANRLKTNIRQLEGVVNKLRAFKNLTNTPPSILIAQNAVRDILNDNQPVPVTVERIIGEVGRTYGVSPQDIRSNKRSAQISQARQVAEYIVREITQMSMAAIGEEFGGRDHSTVVYALQQVEKTMKVDSHYKETIEDIVKNIRDT